MKLTKERQKEQKARDLIFKALQEFHNCAPEIPEFTADRIPSEKYDKELTRKGIDAGIVALLLTNNMSGGSVGNVDLYSLLHHYLLNKESRKQINLILQKH